MTTTCRPADVRVTEHDGFALAELRVAEEPPAGQWNVVVPGGAIAFDPAQPCAARVSWRSADPGQQ